MSTRLIVPGELLQAPTGIDWNTLAEDAGAADARQALEQGFLIDSVSSWVGEYCGQPLGLHATTQVEQAMTNRAGMFPAKCLIDSDGWLHFWARTLPVLSVTLAQWSYIQPPLAWQPIVTGNALPNQNGGNWMLWGDYPHQREIEFFDQDYTSLKHQRAMVQVTYTSGWANAVMTVTATPNGSTPVAINCDSTLGMTAVSGLVGNQVFIFDPAGNSEWVTVTSVDSATQFHAVIASTHTPSATNIIGISAIPQEIKLAVIWACAGLAKVRGAQAVSMRNAGVAEIVRSGGEEADIMKAEYFLGPYRVEF